MKLVLRFVAIMLMLCLALPASARGHGSYSHHSGSHHSRRCTSCSRDGHGRIKRSRTATLAFKKHQPCPATGKSTGRCPGYVIDHVKPLECGGADAPSNMHWQTVAEGKAKDRTERLCH